MMRHSSRVQISVSGTHRGGGGAVRVDGELVGHIVAPHNNFFVPDGLTGVPPERPDWYAYTYHQLPDFTSDSKDLGSFKRRHLALIAVLSHSPFPELAHSVKK